MSGDDKGVKGQLREENPHMYHVHCMAHRLALCTSQAANGMPLIKKYQHWLTSLFYYLKASPAREQELHKVQVILDHPVLKYREIHAVRWLSCFEAVEAVHRTLDPLITFLHQRDAKKDPKAKGLLKTLGTGQFIYITYLMMDVLPVITKLCLQLQRKDLDVARAKVSLDSCLADLERLRTDSQLYTTHLDQFHADVTEEGDHMEFRGHRIHKCNTNLTALKSQFINKLIDNITKRFPNRSIINNFFVMAMRTINFVDNPESYGNNEIEALLQHYGEEKIHKGTISPPIVVKEDVRKEWASAKSIVRSLHYPVDDMKVLWSLLTVYHKEELPNLIHLAQIALCLPLHTADCERTFSIQNQILTKLRNRLGSGISDKLLRVRLHGKGLQNHDFWHSKKSRKITFKS